MFGGKKLKDLTEEDIRRYAAQLAGGSDSGDADGGTPGPEGPAVAAAAPGGTASAPSEARRVAEGIVERAADPHEDDPQFDRSLAVEGRRLELARLDGEQEQERQKRLMAEREAERQRNLREEEGLRLQVLQDMERSQMPAVQDQDGLLRKSIEHYTFADAEDKATIYIELDKDLFEGAAECVTDENIEVCTKDNEITIHLHRVPASKTLATLADWTLHISPLFHSVEVNETTWKIRKGKVSVTLKKRKKQEWRRLVKF